MSDYVLKEKQKPGNLVQTIERISIILNILGQSPEGLTLRDISQKAKLPKGTTHRLLSSLKYFHFVRQNMLTRNYLLGFKLAELGNLLIKHIQLQNEARTLMVNLSEKTGETVHLVILDQNEALYIDKVALNQTGLQMISNVGLRTPLHSSSVGKILLAYLSDAKRNQIIKMKGLAKRTSNTITQVSQLNKHLNKVRIQGFAIDDEENENGVRCIAAPIKNESGEVIAAMSISGPAIRITLETIQASLKDQVCETALMISRNLGYLT